MTNREEIIKDNFIELRKDKMPLSFYLIRKSLLKAVSELQPNIHNRVLDIGCGIMPYREFLKEDKNLEYIGIDIKPTEYHNALKPDFYWDGKVIPFEDNSFDFVLATEFLEHYFDTKSILLEINRVLKPSGILFFTVPSVWPIHEKPYDYHRFTPFALNEFFKISNFSSWKIKPLGDSNYHLCISLALWYDFNLTKLKKKIVSPFLNSFISFYTNKMVKSEVEDYKFSNNELYSGLYGFVKK